MGMVLVVLDAPRVEWVDKRGKHDCADNVFQELVFGEGAVAAVVANNKPTGKGGACKCPGKWEGPPWGDGDEVEAGSH